MRHSEKSIRRAKSAVRDFYINSGIGMEEILEVVVKDACYFTRYDDELHEFWAHIEKDLEGWKNSGLRKSLKIFHPGKEKRD